MRNLYETPEMEIVEFDAEDVITASSGLGGLLGEDDEKGWSGLQ